MLKITRILSGGVGIPTRVCDSQPMLMSCIGLHYSGHDNKLGPTR